MKEHTLTTDELIDKADRLEETGDLTEALHYWRLAVDREADPVALCRLANIAMELGIEEEAERAFVSAIELSPNFPNAHNMLGLLYHERGDLEGALGCFLRSAEIEENIRTLTFLGTVELQLGMTNSARESLTKAVMLDPNHEEAHYNLGLTYSTEAPPEAVNSFRAALKLAPQYAMAHRELGWALARLGQYADAEKHIREAIELDESDGWAYIYLGNLLSMRGVPRGAEQALIKASEVCPDSSVPSWSLAIFYEYENRPHEAAFFYENALHFNPDDPQLNLRFGRFLREIGEAEKAEPFLELARSFMRGSR